MIRRALLLAGAIVLLTATPALAQYNQPGPGAITFTQPNVAPGQQFGVSSCCYPPGSRVSFFIDGMLIGTGTAGADGSASGSFLVPTGVLAGTASGRISVQTAAATSPTPSPTTARTGGLPVTGTDSALPLSLIGAALVAGGGLAVLAGRRRHADASSRS